MKLTTSHLVSIALGLLLCFTWLAGFRPQEGQKEYMTIVSALVGVKTEYHIAVNGQESRVVAGVGFNKPTERSVSINTLLNEYAKQGWRLVSTNVDAGIVQERFYLERDK